MGPRPVPRAIPGPPPDRRLPRTCRNDGPAQGGPNPVTGLIRFPLPHRQRHRPALEAQLRLQLKPLVQGPVLERTLAERVLDVSELIPPALYDRQRGLEQGPPGLGPAVGRGDLV